MPTDIMQHSDLEIDDQYFHAPFNSCQLADEIGKLEFHWKLFPVIPGICWGALRSLHHSANRHHGACNHMVHAS